MERRWCTRVPISVDVILHHNGHQVAKCAVRDISLCGIRLHSGPLSFNRNTQLRLQFLDTDASLIDASVVRNSSDEVSLVFSPTEPDMLRNLIRNYQTSSTGTGRSAGH